MSDVRVVPFLVSEVRLPPREQELLGTEWWPSFGHAVIHRDGVFLFDNGVGFGNAEIDTKFSPRARPIDVVLTEEGISLPDLTGAANCHLHFDHSGQNIRLPEGLPIFVQRAEWAMVHEPDYTVPEWIDVPGLTYEVLEGETDVAPGLRLIPTPGHSPGHQSLVIETSGGTIVLAGQAVQSRAEWDGRTDPSVSGEPGAPDRDAYVRSVKLLQALDPVRVHFAHDPAVWQL
ncbi:MAG TPA: MBL fold metallo-hydrolase [Actinomycetota bacterium]|nr:MBL fold metallo-hydrolase [Actinomycetota bacterium]